MAVNHPQLSTLATGSQEALNMKSAEHWLVHDHTQFEVLLRQCRDAAEIEDWWALEQAFNEMVKELKQHMAQEEEVLFPAYEARTYAPHTPTSSLRSEHDQIVQLIHDTARIIMAREPEDTLEALVYLESLMIKHHEKEEDIFLPMASHILFDEREELSRRLDEFDGTETTRNWDI